MDRAPSVVVVLDDDHEILDTIVEVLTPQGWTVRCADSLEAAAAALAGSERDGSGVVLLADCNVGVPIEVRHAFVANVAGNVTVVHMTGERANESAALMPLLRKPFTIAQLLDAVSRAADSLPRIA